ncbi:MAG: hypothetical protein NZ959_06600 [Armatimonadetes bacterium]|nr:hypothetical protein [Armatimonadota bacterium]MDW8121142.1 hypothetical protein [Armatimonadota bacterium]
MTRRECLVNLGCVAVLASVREHLGSQGNERLTLPYNFFPISYWVGPPATEERYRELADCHFTLTFGGDIDLSHRFGMKALVFDDRVFKALSQRDEESDKLLEEAVRRYRNHPAFFGFFLRDEPNASEFADLARVHQRLLELDPKSVPYINLFPTYATQQQLGTPTYDEYVDQFLKIVKPRVLSYDHYALLQGRDRPDYFLNMEIIRRMSLQAGIPFWFILLSTPHWGYRTPSEGDLRWQVFTALAYGAKGIMYFTYWTVEEEGWGDGIIKKDGTRSERYEIVREINREVKVLGPLLLELDSRQVYHLGGSLPDGASRPNPDSWVQKVDGGSIVVGELVHHKGSEFLFIVNASYKEETNVAVFLKKPVASAYEVLRSPGGGEKPLPVSSLEGISLVKLSLKAGDGRLLRIV